MLTPAQLGFAEGESVSVTREVTAEDIDRFGDAIGSNHPIHADADWVARNTPFGGGRLAHGFFTAALMSRAIVEFYERHGLMGALCYTQSKFVAPLTAGTRVTASLTFTGMIAGKPRLRFATEVRDDAGRVLMVGELHEHLLGV